MYFCKLPAFPQLKSSELTELLQEDCIIPDTAEIKIILHCNMGFFLRSKSLQPQQQQELITTLMSSSIKQYMFYHYFAGACFV